MVIKPVWEKASKFVTVNPLYGDGTVPNPLLITGTSPKSNTIHPSVELLDVKELNSWLVELLDVTETSVDELLAELGLEELEIEVLEELEMEVLEVLDDNEVELDVSLISVELELKLVELKELEELVLELELLVVSISLEDDELELVNSDGVSKPGIKVSNCFSSNN